MASGPTKVLALDAIRGLAILAVIADHYSEVLRPYSWGHLVDFLVRTAGHGWVGVDLFFVLSGFLITGLLWKRQARPNYYADFYARRALRILPVYSLVVLAFALTVAPPAFVVASLFFVSNFAGPAGAYGPLWSLSIEEQFYFVWPAVVRRVSPRAVMYVAAAILCCAPFARIGAFQAGLGQGAPGGPTDSIYYWTIFHLDGLAAGVLLAGLARETSEPGRSFAMAGFVASGGCVALLVGMRLLGEQVLHRSTAAGAGFQFTLVALGCMALVAFALAVEQTRLRTMVKGVLPFYGDISYGLYLIHLLVLLAVAWLCGRLVPSLQPRTLALVTVTLALATATGVAYLSRWHFEEWFLRLKSRLDGRDS